VCIEKFEKRMKKFNDKVFNDIISSFNLDLQGHEGYTFEELDGLKKRGERDQAIISLQGLFSRNSIGEPKVFINGNKGYFLYKETDGSNVKMELSKHFDVWLVTYEEEKKARVTNGEKNLIGMNAAIISVCKQ
jgi:hypothetical protein